MIFREHFLAQKSDKSPHLCDPIFYVRFFGSLPILYSTWTFTVTHLHISTTQLLLCFCHLHLFCFFLISFVAGRLNIYFKELK